VETVHSPEGVARVRIAVTVNGEPRQAEVEPRLLLVHFLRDVLGLTGAHVGCVIGRCGCCTVLWNGRPVKSCMVYAVQTDGSDLLTVEGLGNLPPPPSLPCEGRGEPDTPGLVEPTAPLPPQGEAGLPATPAPASSPPFLRREGGRGGLGLHPLQQAFWEADAVECGYCTSGMLMAAYGLLRQNPTPTDEEIKVAISGNLCRCTGYRNIVTAIRAAADAMAGA
jgi:aerobic carbon-monoxide dehydrogenase small subunit